MSYQPTDGFPYYFDLAKDEDLTDLFASPSTFDLLESIDEEKATHRYAPGKWSIKQVVGHITDHERIKMSRAFQLSRNEKLELWGYDQEALVKNARFDELTMDQLTRDLAGVRSGSVSFIETLSEKQLKTEGKARQYAVSLEAFLKSIIGHERHHLNILKDRYL